MRRHPRRVPRRLARESAPVADGPPLAALSPLGAAPRDTRHNVLVLGFDLAFFLMGLSFASPATILPAFAAHLGASNVAIGALSAVMTTGWFLPSLFAAAHTETLPRKLPFVLRYTVWERVPFLVLALVAFFLAPAAPRLALGALLVTLMVMAGVGGALLPAWMDIVGRTIPATLRGRFLALANVLGNAGGLVGSLVAAEVLAAIGPPRSFGVCFLLGGVFMALSYVALSLTREPPGRATTPPVPIGTYLSRIPRVLRRDVNLAWFLAARACATLGVMSGGFFTVYALGAYGAESWHVGAFTTAILAGQIAGNLVLGWFADRAGHRRVLHVGVAASVAANLVALTAPSLAAFGAVFVLGGVYLAAMNVSGIAALLDFAPDADTRPTYVGLGNTSLAPLLFAAPLAAGLVADTLGFTALFGLSAAFGATAALVLTRVREPRRARPMDGA